VNLSSDLVQEISCTCSGGWNSMGKGNMKINYG
jgi:hypothetical protein